MNVLKYNATGAYKATPRSAHTQLASSGRAPPTRISAAVIADRTITRQPVYQSKQSMPQSDESAQRTFSAVSTSGDTIHNLTPENFHMFLADAGGHVVIVDFYTDWCGPCKLMAAEFEKMKSIFKNVQFAKFNLGKHEGAFANRLSVRSLPTFRFYLNGRMVDEVRGVKIQELRQLLVHHNHPAFALRPLNSVDDL